MLCDSPGRSDVLCFTLWLCFAGRVQDDILLFNVVLAISKVEPEQGGWGEGPPGVRRRRRLRPTGAATQHQHGRSGKEVRQDTQREKDISYTCVCVSKGREDQGTNGEERG